MGRDRGGLPPALCWSHVERSDAGFLGKRRGGFFGGSGWSGAHWEPDQPGWPAQQESTATGADLTGLVRTSWDGDLHRRTAVDVLPADGMQEVRGSNPRSSTGQKRNSNCSNGEYSSKVQQHGRRYLRPGQLGSGSASRLGCWHSQLKPGPGTGLRGRDQEERPIRPSIDTCPPLARGALFRMTLAAVAIGQASSASAGPSSCRRMPAGGCAVAQHGAPGAPRRNLAPLGVRRRSVKRGPGSWRRSGLTAAAAPWRAARQAPGIGWNA